MYESVPPVAKGDGDSPEMQSNDTSVNIDNKTEPLETEILGYFQSANNANNNSFKRMKLANTVDTMGMIATGNTVGSAIDYLVFKKLQLEPIPTQQTTASAVQGVPLTFIGRTPIISLVLRDQTLCFRNHSWPLKAYHTPLILENSSLQIIEHNMTMR